MGITCVTYVHHLCHELESIICESCVTNQRVSYGNHMCHICASSVSRTRVYHMVVTCDALQNADRHLGYVTNQSLSHMYHMCHICESYVPRTRFYSMCVIRNTRRQALRIRHELQFIICISYVNHMCHKLECIIWKSYASHLSHICESYVSRTRVYSMFVIPDTRRKALMIRHELESIM